MLQAVQSKETVFATTEALANALAKGETIILVDNENRENEADLVVAGEFATAEALTFMIRKGGGLLCLALEARRCDALKLDLMPRRNLLDNQANFTVSIEALEGVTTGISAKDRAVTVATAIDPSKSSADISTPGHVFPLKADAGGVKKRPGHTEASIELCKIAGLNPSAVICELLREDGETAKGQDVIDFAQTHGLLLGRIDTLLNDIS